MATSELACTYAVSPFWRRNSTSLLFTRSRAQALILADDGLEITADNILAITKAAKVEVEPYWPSLFAKLFAKTSVIDLITNVGAGEWWQPGSHACKWDVRLLRAHADLIESMAPLSPCISFPKPYSNISKVLWTL